MENDLYPFRLCRADWERVIRALRDQADNLAQDVNRAYKKGAEQYGILLQEESDYLNAIAADIDFILPE